MKKVKKAYYYLFYKLYLLYESASLKWWSDWKATVSIVVLEILIFVIVQGLLTLFINEDSLLLKKSELIVVALIISLFNYFIFLHDNKWRYYFDEFNELPKKMNMIGGIIVWSIIILIFIGLILMYYLVSVTSLNN